MASKKSHSLLSVGQRAKNPMPQAESQDTLKRLEKIGGKRISATHISISGDDIYAKKE